MKHEVLVDQLTAAIEQLDQTHLAVRPLEAVVLLDAHHRQPAAVGAQRVAHLRELLLPRQQCSARNQPLVA